jgi:hypothetical protein
MRFLIILLTISVFVPVSSTLAASVTPPNDLKSFLGLLTGLINIIIPIIFALTFIAIAWGVIRAWIMGDASSDDIDKGKKIALSGVIALTIMVSIWGILRLLKVSIFG